LEAEDQDLSLNLEALQIVRLSNCSGVMGFVTGMGALHFAKPERKTNVTFYLAIHTKNLEAAEIEGLS
jgi:hypothetical protein